MPYVIAASLTIFGIYCAFAFRIYSPFWDDWGLLKQTWPPFLERWPTLEELFSQHNKCRPVLLKLLFLTDYTFSDGTGFLGTLVQLAFQAAFCALLVGFARPQSVSNSKAASIIAKGAAVAVMLFLFNQVHAAHWSRDFNHGWFLTSFLAIIFATQSRWNLSGLLALLSALAMAQGVFVLVPIFLLIVNSKMPSDKKFRVSLIFLGILIFYFYGFDFNRDGAVQGFHLGVPVFFLGFLGNPVSIVFPVAAPIVGAVFFMITGMVLWKTRREILGSPIHLHFTYLLGVVVLAAFFRAEGGLEYAFSSRYHALSSVLWAEGIILIFRYFVIQSEMDTRMEYRWVYLFTVLSVSLSALQYWIYPVMVSRHQIRERIVQDLKRGVVDPEDKRFVPPGLDVRRELEILKAHKKALFSDRWAPR